MVNCLLALYPCPLVMVVNVVKIMVMPSNDYGGDDYGDGGDGSDSDGENGDSANDIDDGDCG